jgi:hypothetical protein
LLADFFGLLIAPIDGIPAVEPVDVSDFASSSRGIFATIRSRIFLFPPGASEHIPRRGRGLNGHPRPSQLLVQPGIHVLGRLPRLRAGIGLGHELAKQLVRVNGQHRDVANLLRLGRLRQVHLGGRPLRGGHGGNPCQHQCGEGCERRLSVAVLHKNPLRLLEQSQAIPLQNRSQAQLHNDTMVQCRDPART